MRLLVACPQCRRQFDAGKLQPGARFRCSCGKVLRVKQAKGHDAAVVRCSGCGAPREAGASACGHCASDFTLHEQDMHTVCPGCLTRVSDKAKFCHSCGKALLASTIVGEQSKLQCPGCPGKPHLRSRQLGREDFSVLECQLCAGLWIESRVFESLTEKAEAKQTIDPALVASSNASVSQSAPTAREKWSYRPCPDCGAMMQRRNYARRSGVIIDVCREHGIWFDADELQSILAWIREGGRQKARQRAHEEQREEEHRRQIAKASEPEGGYDEGWFTWQSGQRGGGSMLVDVFIDSFFG